jgi:hypothetical protein
VPSSSAYAGANSKVLDSATPRSFVITVKQPGGRTAGSVVPDDRPRPAGGR